jgi:hypothetical protein
MIILKDKITNLSVKNGKMVEKEKKSPVFYGGFPII